MKTVTRNEADFSELFDYAGKEFKIDWNDCCDLFHRSQFLNYHSNTEFNLEELEYDLADTGPYGLGKDPTSQRFLASTIVVSFMKKHGVSDITIVGTGEH